MKSKSIDIAIRITAGFGHLGLLAVVCLVFVLSGCGSEKSETEIGIEKSIQAETATASEANLPEMRFFPGTVKSKVSMTLSAKMPGYVQQVPHEIGDFVSSGELLIRLDDRDIRARINSLLQSERAVREQRAALIARQGYVDATYRRIDALYKEGSATQDEYDRINSERAAIRGQVKALDARAREVEAALSEARNQLRYVEIKAPSSGWVTGRHVDRGTLVMPGTPLIDFETQGDGAWFASNIDVTMMPDVKQGQVVTILFPSLNRTVQARITQVGQRADALSHTFPVLCDISSSSINSGVYGRLYVSKGISKRLMAPCRTLVDRGGLTGVFVVDSDRKLHWRVVKVGRAWNLKKQGPVLLADIDPGLKSCGAEILTGLTAGETLVASNLSMAREGLRLE